MREFHRKAIALTLSASMLSAMCMTASAADNRVSVTLDGRTIETAAYVDGSSRTQAPLDIAVKMGLSYHQDGDEVTFVKGTEELILEHGGAAGDTTVVEGYVPLKVLAERFGYQLTWNGRDRVAALVSPDASAVDFDSIENLEKDFSQAAQLPLTGYYSKSFEDGRSVKVYIAEEASIRSYFTVVAVPDGVSTKQFLEDEGWIALADQKGEGLFVLEPGANGWGSAQEESAYLNEAVTFLKRGVNDNSQTVFSTFGEFYLVGYGKGAAALELWAAANPTFVISQAYVSGGSASKADLEAAGAVLYDGSNTSGYDPGFTTDAEFQAALNECGMTQIAKKDVPVPTLLADYTGSMDYWKAANDCVATADENGVYHQKKDSDAIQTAYANSQLPASAQYGISQVKVTGSKPSAAEIYNFLSAYTRYDNTFAYSNALTYRLDYTAARVAAQQDAKDGKVKDILSNGTQVLAQADTIIAGHGTVQVGVIAFSDNSGDGKWDPREYILYIPEGFQGKKMPVLVIYPGNTQTDSIFLDSTLWWQVADKEGVALAFVCETYNANPCSVSHADSDKFYDALVTLLKEKIDGKYADLDFTRIYGSGQSAGSMATQGFVRTNPEFYAAAASTSGMAVPQEGAWLPDGVGGMVPDFVITGQSDLANLMPDLWGSELANDWISYLFKVNNMADAKIGTPENEHEFINDRTKVYSWENQDGIVMVKYGYTMLRAHNCSPYEMPILWDFLEHFSFEKAADGTVTRYYSASAFEKDDAVVIK